MKKVLILITVILGNISLFAQQDAMYTQYMFNQLLINPGYTGSHDAWDFTMLYRKQWVGIEGAPTTQTFSTHTPLPNEKLALGLSLVNDKIGIHNDLGVFTNFAYRILFDNSTLSFGMQAGVVTHRSNFGDLSTSSTNNTISSIGNVQYMAPSVGAGIYYYSDRYYLGFSIPRIADKMLAEQVAGDKIISSERHYFLSGGYVFDVKENIKLKPNMLLKYVDGAPVSADINLNVLLNEVLWAGLSYRSFDSFDLLVEVLLTDQLRLGYAYDFYTTTDIRKASSGSHEVMLNYVMKFNKSKVISPRYF